MGQGENRTRVLKVVLIIMVSSALSVSAAALSTYFHPFSAFSYGATDGNLMAINTSVSSNSSSTPIDQYSWTDLCNNKRIDHLYSPALSPNPEADAYFNASPITQEQKDRALKIASASDVYKEYMQYPNNGWTYTWTYPYTGAIHLSTTINPNSPGATVYGLLSFDVDINKGCVLNGGFLDWHKYW